MLPLRRKKSQDGDGVISTDGNAETTTTTTYHSFQDTMGQINNNNSDGDESNGLNRGTLSSSSPGRRFMGFRRNASNSSDSQPSHSSHRGFTTSIHDMFQSHETERIDCCAMTCCGMMQSDRDRYFLQGVTPPSLIRRLWLHIVFPCFLFSIAGYAAMNVPDYRINNLLTTGIILLLLYYLVLQCIKGRAKRIEIRKDLLWTKAQLLDQRRQNLSVILEQERPDDHGQEQEYYLGQRRRDFFAAHPCLCHCYVEDRLVQRDEDEDEESSHANLCTSIWEGLCPPCCGMHLQCCGVCALAQEGREVETALLPPSYLRVDYITMQPYADYYPSIYQARHQGIIDENNTDETTEASSPSCMPRLSRLSIQILQVLVTLIVFLVAWTFAGRLFWKYVLTANIPAWRLFKWTDMIVFFVTWIQAVGLLVLFVWLANRPKKAELSLDALIKFFAAGFCLSTAMAIFWEVVLGMIVKILVSLFLTLSGVDLTSRPDAQITFLGKVGEDVGNNSKNFLQAYGNDHPVFFTLYLILASFFLAAFIEEMCKYYGYRMVEHPDFLSKREMEDAMNVVHGEFEVDPDASRTERYDFSKQRRSFQSHGAAVTAAMVAVAMGFTCCENLVYVFVYSGSSLELELSVLLARSFFPVHALAAALQSVGVVQRDIEGRSVSRLGRIIGPAVLFHGFYDFLILWIDFLAGRNGVYSDNDGDVFEWPVLLSFCASVMVVAAALWYYMLIARRQRNRLVEMDRDESAMRSSLI